ncbi:MAG: BatA domain-containing protein [Planctomycetota bacterium]
MSPALAQLAGLFSAPALAVAGAVCVAIPVVIHLLSRSRRKRAEWGAMRFVRLAYRKQKRKLLVQRWLLLAARCLVVVLAGLALAGPLLPEGWLGLGEAITGGTIPGAGRTVHVVLDDGLSARAEVSGVEEGVRRWDRVRGMALEVIDGLAVGDRVQVWRASQGGAVWEAVAAPTVSHDAVRSAVEELEPSFGRSEVAATLAAVAAALDAENDGVSAGDPLVFVLSDWARGLRDVERAWPAEAAGLGERATVVVSRPEPGRGNVQVASLRPRRGLVLAPGSGANVDPAKPRAASNGVSVEVGVRRFEAADAVAEALVRMTLRRPDGEAAVSVERTVAWAVGQTEASVGVELPLVSGQLPEGDWSVTAEVVPGAGQSNALTADDARQATVTVRRSLRVGLVASLTGGGGSDRLGPGAFVRAALTAGGGDSGGVEVVDLAAMDVGAGSLARLDAAVVLRPDAVGPEGWPALSSFAEAGGLVWVFPPAGAVSVEANRDWFTLMAQATGLGWALTDGAVELDEVAKLVVDGRPPAELVLLAADWAALLGPVRVSRRLGIEPTEAAAWIEMLGGGPLLLAGEVGAGRVLLGTAAVDPGWTNLPAKPVFPALLQDALRGVLGATPEGDGSGVVVGDRPVLGSAWSGVSAVGVVVGEASAEVAVGQAAEGDRVVRRVLEPLPLPGVYRGSADVDAGSMRGVGLAVNVPAGSGDVRGVDGAALGAWLGELGDWSFAEADAPAAVLAEAERRVDLGRVLLWGLLGLVVAEMFLARWFSFAGVGGGGVGGRRAAAPPPRASAKKIGFRGRAAVWLAVVWLTPAAGASWLDGWLGLREVSLSDATAWGWRTELPAWAWVLIVLAAAGASWLSYRNLLGAKGARIGLASLRGLLLVLIAVLLAGPQVVRTDETVEEDVLLVLVDRSASMATADVEAEGGVLVSRDAALRSALEAGELVFGDGGLGRGRTVAWLGFGDGAYEIPPALGPGAGEALGVAEAGATLLRTAVEGALRRAGGRPIAGLVVISDGRSPEATGEGLVSRLARESAAVFAVPVGAARPPRDLAVTRVEPPASAFVDDGVPVSVVVEQPGGVGGEMPEVDPARVTVRLIDTASGEVLDERTLDGVGLGRPVRLEGRGDTAGEAAWRVEVSYDDPTGEAELNLANNTEAFTVALTDRAIRVLYVEGYPRWEYRYLKNMLIREKSIDSSMLLLSADRDFAQEGDTPITRLPATDEEWRRYDVVILGDVPAEALGVEVQRQLSDLVAQRGAGLLWVAGSGANAATYAGTRLGDLLPMREPESVAALPVARLGVRPTGLAGALSVLQLAERDAEPGSNDAVRDGWPAGLPGLRWAQDLGALKPAVEVLANFTAADSASAAAGAPAGAPSEGPAVTRLRFGAGQSVYVATDETWRWRYARGEVYFERFWVQLVRLLGRGAAARGDAPVRLAVSGRSTPVGGTVVVDLDMEDAALRGRELPGVRVSVRRSGDDASPAGGVPVAEIDLRPTDRGEGGGYRATWTADVGGAFELVVTEPALADLGLSVPLTVVADDDERRRVAADPQRLVELAEATGGRVVPLTELAKLAEPGVIPNLSRTTANDVAEPVGRSALALGLIVLLVTLEWVGRKLVRLV